jgi:hypothetical protein
MNKVGRISGQGRRKSGIRGAAEDIGFGSCGDKGDLDSGVSILANPFAKVTIQGSAVTLQRQGANCGLRNQRIFTLRWPLSDIAGCRQC